MLDNGEHLTSELSELVGELLESTTALRVLLTSREPLGLPGEDVFALVLLGLPERDGTIASVVRSDAGSLSSNCPNIGSYTIEPTLASLASTVSALTPPATGNNYTSGPCSHPGNLVNTCAYAVADPSTVVTAVDQKLTSLQQGYYDDVLTQMGSSSEIADAVTALNGARALVDDYTALALPVALASDPTLRSVVYGPNDLLDDSSPGDQLQASSRTRTTTRPQRIRPRRAGRSKPT